MHYRMRMPILAWLGCGKNFVVTEFDSGPKQTLLDLVKRQIADFDYLGKDIDLLIESSELLSEYFPERKIELIEVRRLIADYKADHAAKIAVAPKSFPEGRKVRVTGEQMGWGHACAACPTIGMVGRVRGASNHRDDTTDVLFSMAELGYESDDDEEYSCPMWNYTLELVPDDAISILPDPIVIIPHPASPGKRWAALLSDGTEVGGHCCTSWQELNEYANKFGFTMAELDHDGSYAYAVTQ